MSENGEPQKRDLSSVGLASARLIIALAQGVALYLLYSAYDAKVWPASDGYWFAPLLLVSLFVPLLAIQGAGNIRTRTLMIWVVAAAVIVAGLAWYDIWHGWPWDWRWTPNVNGPKAIARVLPSFAIIAISIPGLFIAHALVAGGDADRRFMARYTTHFDVTWKCGLQLALSVAFVGAFWLLLRLGAGLFNLINLSFFEDLIEHKWFAIPATTLATAAALHLTDVRAGLVRGTRTLALVLLSWLLPLSTLLVAGFLISLVATGLEPLWKTRHASALLLVAAAALIVLINAAYQDGEPERRPPTVLHWAMRLASLLLIPTTILSAIALILRVAQYGWTADRVELAACIAAAGGYAAGYAITAIGFRPRLLESWNFGMALVVLALILAIFSPVADPRRISVADQVARLESGATKPGKFDYAYLRWDGGRFGYEALQEMKARGGAGHIAYVREQAETALKSSGRYALPTGQVTSPGEEAPGNLASRIHVFPEGKALPNSFLKNDWRADPAVGWLAECLFNSRFQCDAAFADFDGDGRDEIVLVEEGFPQQGTVYRSQSDNTWRMVGQLSFPQGCFAVFRDALRSGRFSLSERQWRPKDLAIEGTRVRISEPQVLATPPPCPDAKPSTAH